MATDTATVHKYDSEENSSESWGLFINAMHSGQRVEIDEEMFYYWLEVLPPASWGKTYTLDGSPQRSHFGFAEGTEYITAFWRESSEDGSEIRYFCQRTDVINASH